MKCTLPGGHLKVFGKALHSLSRIGDDLWLDPLEKGSVLPVFRCLTSLDRNVEKCDIYTNFSLCHMVFQLFCKHGLTKTHNLAYEDCEPLQAICSKASCPNILKMQARLLLDVIIHFPTCQEEVTLTATLHQITFKTYIDEDISSLKITHTEVHLHPDEFNYFQIGMDSEVTFCLKEVRGFLSFAETTSALIAIHFSNPGQPIVFSLDDIVFEASFILATLSDVDDNNCSPKSQAIVLKSPALSKECRRSSSAVKNRTIGTDATKKRNRQPVTTSNPTLPAVREEPHNALSYNKFCTFFGAISSEQPEKPEQPFYSLATASEDEDDGCRKEFSPAF
ncbi:cell cycle checkpoint control protein RAD9B isoform X2 [Hyperolius riggenbachi]|uniref:cell cycle checkpoint control protein RAD9B isoform X2 n=1 Tax=Hyperolius riggenbachi TaxID=752182 RepID=UPI0035A37072